MTRSSSTGADPVGRFLRNQRFRHRETRRIYGHILRAFQASVGEGSIGSSGASVSVSNLQEWLCEKRQMWPLHMVCHRARLVERFLEWSHALGVIDTNPFAELHRHYGPRTTPIVRALVSDDVEAALRDLRPEPRFGSFHGKVMAEHVDLMRSLGYRYDVNEGMLLRFDRFLQRRAELAGKPLNQLIEVWAQSDPSPNRLCEAKRVGQPISKAMHRLDPAAAIFPMSIEISQPVRLEQRRPYVYSDAEMQQILKAALAFPSPKAPLRPLSLFTMVVLAYCAGLRLGEIVGLTLADVNLQDGTIEIRDTKFFKDRRLPLAAGVIAALKNYLVAREQAGGLVPSDYPGTLVTDRGPSYEAEELAGVDQQKCLSHLMRNVKEVVTTKSGRAREFGEGVLNTLQQANQLWRDHRAGKVEGEAFQQQGQEIEDQLTYRLRRRQLTDSDNQRLLDGIGLHNDRGHVLRFLHNPAIEPTNNRAERALRPAVIARKVSQCSKTQRGADAFAAFTTVIRTIAKKANTSIAQGLHSLLRPADSSQGSAPPKNSG